MDIFKMMCQSIGISFKQTENDCAQIPVKQWGVPVLTKRFLNIAQQQNKFVHVWTIDDKDQMFELIEFGVDGLMTDKPSILKEAMMEKGLF
jgi:glycerophosphoryl diester phosphodiesterase